MYAYTHTNVEILESRMSKFEFMALIQTVLHSMHSSQLVAIPILP